VAAAARVEVAYLVVAAGTVLYVYLNRAAKDLTIFQFDSPEADVVAARVLAVAAFVLLQQAAGLDPRSWLRLGGEPAAAADAGGPLGSVFAFPTPVAGVVFALLFVLPVVALSAAGVRLLPVYGTGFPSEARALLTLLVAPLSEEVFFRAWLLNAFERSGGAASQGLIVSAGLYGLYVVPLSSVRAGFKQNGMHPRRPQPSSAPKCPGSPRVPTHAGEPPSSLRRRRLRGRPSR
jgi:membrane protease YdiL (CAAX protease family)